ncbi:TIP-1 family-domain-containing protein [Fimicolochytrium jonesii]|uniref:TIP-1 family-domain-containing protein n=1 Tax=Fimicolochytrium jonesii TaxID=1396493 RepID=UPI0022FE3A36|nr:TIP-1 family-domain-containing protein [Fimicolochytrium jonesii]KAI8826805.1 TIP-1 family-domain-containing protein [Fimicolochytrium jonesii]
MAVATRVSALLNERLADLSSLADLPKFTADLEDQRLKLAGVASQLSKSGPVRLSQVCSDTRSAQARLEQLRGRRKTLLRKVEAFPRGEHHMETLMEAQTKLSRLKLAKRYVDLLLDVDDLSSEVESNTARDIKRALTAYDKLQAIYKSASRLNSNQPFEGTTAARSEDDALHPALGFTVQPEMLKYLNTVIFSLYDLLKGHLSKKLEHALEALGWPKAVSVESLRRQATDPHWLAFKSAFGDMLLLQAPKTNGEADKPDSLPAMEVLLRLPVLQYKYHFTGERPTNRLDKPEWSFTKVLAMIRDFSPFLCGPVQSLLEEYGYVGWDAKNHFVEGLLDAVMYKLRLDIPKLLENPRLFTHASKETYAFDKALREVHLYTKPSGKWDGCASVFTERREWFEQWLIMEMAAAKATFEDAVQADKAWEFVEDYFGEGDAKPTQSAELFIKILEAITDRYRLLPDYSHRLAFLNELQLPLLEDYLQEVRDGIKRHVSAFHPVNTAGASLPSKINRLQMLCRYICSLQFISSNLREWANLPFFIEFREQVRKQNKLTNEADDVLEIDPSLKATAAELLGDQASLFDEVVAAYDATIRRLQDLVVQDIMQEFSEAMWQYDKRRNWVISSSDSDSDSPTFSSSPLLDEITPEFCTALDTLTSFLPAIHSHLPVTVFLSLLQRDIGPRLDEHFFTKLILRGRFNAQGAKKVSYDVSKGLAKGVLGRWVRKPDALLRRTTESLSLLTLPLRTSRASGTKAPALVTIVELLLESSNGQRSDDEDSNNDAQDTALREALESVGVYRLSTKKVQQVVERRVEVENLLDSLA